MHLTGIVGSWLDSLELLVIARSFSSNKSSREDIPKTNHFDIMCKNDFPLHTLRKHRFVPEISTICLVIRDPSIITQVRLK